MTSFPNNGTAVITIDMTELDDDNIPSVVSTDKYRVTGCLTMAKTPDTTDASQAVFAETRELAYLRIDPDVIKFPNSDNVQISLEWHPYFMREVQMWTVNRVHAPISVGGQARAMKLAISRRVPGVVGV